MDGLLKAGQRPTSKGAVQVCQQELIVRTPDSKAPAYALWKLVLSMPSDTELGEDIHEGLSREERK